MPDAKRVWCGAVLGGLLAHVSACGAPDVPVHAPVPALEPLAPAAETEAQIRKRLGVPESAKTVVFFAQTSHLDIDWQHTMADYYALYVADAFVGARKLLADQPRAFYSVAEMAFLEQHVATQPQELPALQAAAKRGALQVVGGGMTSPDTLLPETELLLRDFLYGTQFAEEVIGTSPTAAWLPDSFGHAATVPDVLAAVGLGAVGMARIDGAPDIAQQIIHPGIEPAAGSNAATLKALGSADFLWHGSGGATVLGHYLSQTGMYCSGENIDYDEILQSPGGHTGPFMGDDPAFTDGRIAGYIAESLPLARTPYLFVPVGCDFQPPKPKLLSYLDGYNQRQWPTSGVFAAVATFADYAKLVQFHAAALPTLEGDLAPVYMGFYGSRGEVKRAIRDAARPFWVAEMFATLLGDEGTAIVKRAAPALKELTRADHHDFVPGTSTDLVVAGEQLPLCQKAEQAGQTALREVATALAARVPEAPESRGRIVVFNPAAAEDLAVATAQVPLPPSAFAFVTPNANWWSQSLPSEASTTVAIAPLLKPLSWQVFDLRPSPPWSKADRLPADWQRLIQSRLLDKDGVPATGAAVVRAAVGDDLAVFDRRDGLFVSTSAALNGVFLRDWADGGGLWRMGQEMEGCTLLPLPQPAGFDAVESLATGANGLPGGILLHSPTAELAVAADSGIDLTVTTRAEKGVTRTLVLQLPEATGQTLETSQPGGSVVRPAERLFSPTFWPAVSWARIGTTTILLRQATGVRLGPGGEVELMAARDVRLEKCDVMGGTGTDTGPHTLALRIVHTKNAAEAQAAADAWNRPLTAVYVPATGQAPDPSRQLPDRGALATLAGDGVLSALKPAERGDGLILRVLLLPGPVTVTLGPQLAGRTLTAVDAVERDLRPVAKSGETWTIDRATYGAIASFRLR